jgi:predicted PurR-regulated permease PerM
MNANHSEKLRGTEEKVFLWLILAVSVAFIWTMVPLYGAVLWAVVLAILFTRLYQQMCTWMKGRRNLAAAVTVVVIVLIVILPLTVLITSLVAEASAVYEDIQKGEINFGAYLQQILEKMPGWATELFDRMGLSNLRTVREQFSSGISEASKLVAVQAIQIGQNTFTFFLNVFVMLYLLFFLVRDGAEISDRIRDAIPLQPQHKRALFNKFTVVIRATVKGNMVVAVLQGGL